MENEYPMYPSLSDEGKKEAQQLIDKFKIELSESANNIIQTLYCDIIHDIESDSWQNFRNQLLDGFKNYNNSKIQARYDFKQLRSEIFKEYKDEIVKDLNQDIYEENIALKKQIQDLSNLLHNMRT